MCRENNIQKKIKCVLGSLAWLSRVSFGFHGFVLQVNFPEDDQTTMGGKKKF
jgi:hypothetical protein